MVPSFATAPEAPPTTKCNLVKKRSIEEDLVKQKKAVNSKSTTSAHPTDADELQEAIKCVEDACKIDYCDLEMAPKGGSCCETTCPPKTTCGTNTTPHNKHTTSVKTSPPTPATTVTCVEPTTYSSVSTLNCNTFPETCEPPAEPCETEGPQCKRRKR